VSEVHCRPKVGLRERSLQRSGMPIDKRVHHFVAFFAEGEAPACGERHWRTKELHWATDAELETLPLMHGELRPIVLSALGEASPV